MNNILFITAFKDINRGKYKHYTRTNDTYFDYFFNLANTIQYNLIIYVENYIKEILLSRYRFRENIIFMNLNTVDTFYRRYNEINKIIINSKFYQDKIPESRKNNPEHCHAEYNSITNSKSNFLKNTKKYYPNYEFYAWVDFGCVRNSSTIPYSINLLKLTKQITFHCFQKPLVKRHEYDMLSTWDIYFDGSQIIIHTSLIDLFDFLCNEKLKKWCELIVTDDDQNLVLQIYYDHPELFNLIINDKWYSLFNSLAIKK